jgi:hypothetical protein
LSQKLNAGWNAKHADTQNTGEKPTLMKQLMSHLPPAQQEGAGKNPALFAVDALQGSRAKNAQLCRPGTPASRADIRAITDGDTAAGR